MREEMFSDTIVELLRVSEGLVMRNLTAVEVMEVSGGLNFGESYPYYGGFGENYWLDYPTETGAPAEEAIIGYSLSPPLEVSTTTSGSPVVSVSLSVPLYFDEMIRALFDNLSGQNFSGADQNSYIDNEWDHAPGLDGMWGMATYLPSMMRLADFHSYDSFFNNLDPELLEFGNSGQPSSYHSSNGAISFSGDGRVAAIAGGLAIIRTWVPGAPGGDGSNVISVNGGHYEYALLNLSAANDFHDNHSYLMNSNTPETTTPRILTAGEQSAIAGGMGAWIAALEELVKGHEDAVLKTPDGKLYLAKTLLSSMSHTINFLEAGLLVNDALNDDLQISQVAGFIVSIGVTTALAGTALTPLSIFWVALGAGMFAEQGVKTVGDLLIRAKQALLDQYPPNNPTIPDYREYYDKLKALFNPTPPPPLFL